MPRAWPLLAMFALGALPAGASPRQLPVRGPLRVEELFSFAALDIAAGCAVRLAL
jgi:hypothetical protein